MTALAPAHPKLTTDEARALTEEIRTSLDGLHHRILRAHDGEAWKALGYESFREWSAREFDLAQSHIYQLLNYARVERNLSAMAEKPSLISNDLQLTERQARPLAQLETPEQQREAFALAQSAAAAEGKPMAARHVEAAVERIKPKAKRNGTPAPPHAPGQISDAELDAGDKGDPVWLSAFHFRECDEAQQLKAAGLFFDDMKPKNQMLVTALYLSALSPEQLVELGKRIDFGALKEASK